MAKPTPIDQRSTNACRPPRPPATKISVVAVASGKGSLPCISATK
jgi:hypothetical protein